MNGNIVQGRIYAGYAKTAQKVGQLYALYRGSPIDPITPGYQLDSIYVAWSTLTRPFVATAKWSDETWLLWADGRLLQPRDFLVGPDGTFYVGDMQPNLPIQAVRCTHVAATITRPGYTTADNGTLVANGEVIASNLPMLLKLKSVNVKTTPGGALTSGVGIGVWLAFLPMAEATLKRNDVITDTEGVQYEVDAPSWTPMGYVAQVRLANP